MKKQNTLGLVFGLILFIAGVIIGLFFLFRVVWANVEGNSFWEYPEVLTFDPEIETDAAIQTLRCPIIMTPDETKEVWVRFKNPKDFDVNPVAQVTISHPGQPDEMDRFYLDIPLAPKAKYTDQYTVSSENIRSGSVIFVRVFLSQAQYFPPSLTRHCSIVITQMGNLSSKTILWLTVSVAIGLMLIGTRLLWVFSSDKMRRSQKLFHRIVFIMVSLLISLLSALLRLNFLAIGLSVLTAIIIVSVLENILMDLVNI